VIDIEKMKAHATEVANDTTVCGNQIEREWAKTVLSLLSELEAAKRENSDMMKALAECRDAMPMEYDSPHLGGAVGDPLEVPLFVKDIVARLRAELEAREADRRDAERYRYLRENAYIELSCGSPRVDGWTAESLDGRIDALAQRQEGEEK
jgi:hypothetical protein